MSVSQLQWAAGLAHCVSLKPTWRRTLPPLQVLPAPSGRDALRLCLAWLQLSPERPQCEPAQGPGCGADSGWCPAQEGCTTERALSPPGAAV